MDNSNILLSPKRKRNTTTTTTRGTANNKNIRTFNKLNLINDNNEYNNNNQIKNNNGSIFGGRFSPTPFTSSSSLFSSSSSSSSSKFASIGKEICGNNNNNFNDRSSTPVSFNTTIASAPTPLSYNNTSSSSSSIITATGLSRTTYHNKLRNELDNHNDDDDELGRINSLVHNNTNISTPFSYSRPRNYQPSGLDSDEKNTTNQSTSKAETTTLSSVSPTSFYENGFDDEHSGSIDNEEIMNSPFKFAKQLISRPKFPKRQKSIENNDDMYNNNDAMNKGNRDLIIPENQDLCVDLQNFQNIGIVDSNVKANSTVDDVTCSMYASTSPSCRRVPRGQKKSPIKVQGSSSFLDAITSAADGLVDEDSDSDMNISRNNHTQNSQNTKSWSSFKAVHASFASASTISSTGGIGSKVGGSASHEWMDLGTPLGVDSSCDLSANDISIEDDVHESARSYIRFNNIVAERSSNVSTSFERRESSSQNNSHDDMTISRPLPDQSAFDRSVSSNGRQPNSSSPVCPATPMRTPNWIHEENDEDEDDVQHSSVFNSQHITFARQNSLQLNKVLLSQSDEFDNGVNISYESEFDEIGLLGSGTFANVYKVRTKDGSKKEYAIKKSRRQFRSKKDREILLREVRAMKRIGDRECKYIIQLVKAWQEDGYFYVQLDLASKGTLKDLLSDVITNGTALPDCTIWRIMHDTASGLQHIHTAGMVHLDIKPANLLICSSGIIKIGDFGMAAEQGSGEDGQEGDSKYMAPELLNSSDRLPPADIFSLGLTLYECCMADPATGLYIMPSEGTTWRAMREGPVNMSGSVSRSAELCSIIQDSLLPDPNKRPTTTQILNIPAIRITGIKEDKILMSARDIIVQDERLFRTASFKSSGSFKLNNAELNMGITVD